MPMDRLGLDLDIGLPGSPDRRGSQSGVWRAELPPTWDRCGGRGDSLGQARGAGPSQQGREELARLALGALSSFCERTPWEKLKGQCHLFLLTQEHRMRKEIGLVGEVGASPHPTQSVFPYSSPWPEAPHSQLLGDTETSGHTSDKRQEHQAGILKPSLPVREPRGGTPSPE